MRVTHTYVELPLSPAAFEEIKSKMEAAGYTDQFMEDGAIDMYGIGVKEQAPGG